MAAQAGIQEQQTKLFSHIQPVFNLICGSAGHKASECRVKVLYLYIFRRVYTLCMCRSRSGPGNELSKTKLTGMTG